MWRVLSINFLLLGYRDVGGDDDDGGDDHGRDGVDGTDDGDDGDAMQRSVVDGVKSHVKCSRKAIFKSLIGTYEITPI